MFYSDSEIERLDLHPHHLTDFEQTSRGKLEQMYKEMKEEEEKDLREFKTKECKFITSISLKE